MPLASVIPVLTAGFLKSFDPVPESTADAAVLWARAYANYCLAGGAVIVPPRQAALAEMLAQAFVAQGGSGAAGVVAALAAFWPGTAVPGMAPTAEAVVFTPTGDLSLVVPGVDDAPATAQAEALAQVVHALTVAAVKVVIPPSTALVPIV